MTAKEFASKFNYEVIGTMVTAASIKDAIASLMVVGFKESGGLWICGSDMVSVSADGTVFFQE